MFFSLVDITYKWGTYSSKWDLLWNVEPFSRPFSILFGAYSSFSNISMPFLRRVNHVLHMKMEISRMNKQDEAVPSNV
jgi:hypothetical protein